MPNSWIALWFCVLQTMRELSRQYSADSLHRKIDFSCNANAVSQRELRSRLVSRVFATHLREQIGLLLTTFAGQRKSGPRGSIF